MHIFSVIMPHEIFETYLYYKNIRCLSEIYLTVPPVFYLANLLMRVASGCLGRKYN